MKVLIAVSTGFSETGGLSSVMLNYYRNINDNDISFDFCSTNSINEKLTKEFSDKNSSYYNLGNRKRSLIKYLRNLYALIKDNNYDIIHVNGNSSTMIFELFVAKLAGIKKRISHVHSAHSDYPLLDMILRPFFKKSYTLALAASKEAGKRLFSKEFIVLNNAIDIEHYTYNDRKRMQLRKELNISNNKVIGMVGKFTSNKNQSFLLDIFYELKKIDENYVLVLIGDGPEKENLYNICVLRNLESSVIFAGLIEDTADILSALDIFVFTSKSEGFGMALLEAQSSGLVCFASDTLPKRVKQSQFLEFISLEESPVKWAIAIDQYNLIDRNLIQAEVQKGITNNELNIKKEAYKLVDLYKSLYKR